MKKKKNTRTPDKEDKAKYFQVADFYTVKIKLNSTEMTLFEKLMSDLHATNKSAVIRYKLFGLKPEKVLANKIKGQDEETILLAIKNEISLLNANFSYIRHRYDKDMRVLYREEGVDMKKWTSATNRWHAEASVRMDTVIELLTRIAKALGVDFFSTDTLKSNGFVDINSGEENDRANQIAQELYNQRYNEGRTDLK